MQTLVSSLIIIVTLKTHTFCICCVHFYSFFFVVEMLQNITPVLYIRYAFRMIIEWLVFCCSFIPGAILLNLSVAGSCRGNYCSFIGIVFVVEWANQWNRFATVICLLNHEIPGSPCNLRSTVWNEDIKIYIYWKWSKHFCRPKTCVQTCHAVCTK